MALPKSSSSSCSSSISSQEEDDNEDEHEHDRLAISFSDMFLKPSFRDVPDIHASRFDGSGCRKRLPAGGAGSAGINVCFQDSEADTVVEDFADGQVDYHPKGGWHLISRIFLRGAGP